MPLLQSECNYKIRVSTKAKRVLLKAKPCLGLEVVVPVGFDKSLVPDIVRRNKKWIDRAFANMDKSLLSGPPPLPEMLDFPAVSESWKVNMRLGMAGNRLEQGVGMVLVRAENREVAIDLLKKFISRRARVLLVPMLKGLSQDTGLYYKRTQIRIQKTRWGSCSSRGSISLNAKLLFLSPDVAEYVMLHELCHTRFLNHSPMFWAMVEKVCPDWRAMEKQLARAVVPAWLEYSVA